MNIFTRKRIGIMSIVIGIVVIIGAVYYFSQKPPVDGNWQEHLTVSGYAEFNGNQVTVRNVRNFRYGPTESDMHPGYYDRTYDLDTIKQVWFVTEPFNENKIAAHTFVSFEFENGDFLAISIEARKREGQKYDIVKGIGHTYPLIYIPADERDVVLLRANLRKDKVFIYPVKLKNPDHAKTLLVDMLNEMNRLTTTNPRWYNTFFANCTSSIAKHVNKIDPGRIPMFSWKLWLTASADKLALDAGLLDTDLSISEAREKYSINEISELIGDTPNYSQEIRKGFSD